MQTFKNGLLSHGRVLALGEEDHQFESRQCVGVLGEHTNAI
jgi:hypothetical protein